VQQGEVYLGIDRGIRMGLALEVMRRSDPLVSYPVGRRRDA
jgi:hypothetical protein